MQLLADKMAKVQQIKVVVLLISSLKHPLQRHLDYSIIVTASKSRLQMAMCVLKISSSPSTSQSSSSSSPTSPSWSILISILLPIRVRRRSPNAHWRTAKAPQVCPGVLLFRGSIGWGGHDADGHDEDGHDEDGQDEDGLDEDGHDEGGPDEDGHDKDGHDEDGYDEGGRDDDHKQDHGWESLWCCRLSGSNLQNNSRLLRELYQVAFLPFHLLSIIAIRIVKVVLAIIFIIILIICHHCYCHVMSESGQLGAEKLSTRNPTWTGQLHPHCQHCQH